MDVTSSHTEGDIPQRDALTTIQEGPSEGSESVKGDRSANQLALQLTKSDSWDLVDDYGPI